MIIFVVPVYNEERNIERLLNDLSGRAREKNWDYRICIADDGSRDNTVRIAESMKGKIPLEVAANPVNMGPGAAFDRGFRHVLEYTGPEDIVVTMEADNTSDLEILDKMLERIRSGADLVLASCYAKTGEVKGTTFYRKILSKGANLLIRMISRNKEIQTYSSFYRCYRAGLLKRAYELYGNRFVEEQGFVCAVDILLKLQKLGIRVEEVPMVLKCDQRVDKSKMKTLLTTLSYLRLFSREVFRNGALFH